MKKWTAILFSALMVFILAACGNTQKENGTAAGGSTDGNGIFRGEQPGEFRSHRRENISCLLFYAGNDGS